MTNSEERYKRIQQIVSSETSDQTKAIELSNYMDAHERELIKVINSKEREINTLKVDLISELKAVSTMLQVLKGLNHTHRQKARYVNMIDSMIASKIDDLMRRLNLDMNNSHPLDLPF